MDPPLPFLFSMVIERVQMMMRFPHSTKINKLPGPKLERKYGKSSRAGRRLIGTDDGLTVVVN